MQAAPRNESRGNMKKYLPVLHAMIFTGIVLSAFTPGFFQTDTASAAVFNESAQLPVSTMPAPWFALSLVCIAVSLGGVRILSRYAK